CGPEGDPGAVLLRAGIPEQGVEEMIRRRRRDDHLSDGPGKLCAALGITGAHDGTDAFSGEVRVEGRALPGTIIATPRIGISRATERPWRLVWAPTLADS
ncbi:MAG TPA: DNA-3-methyladenine glycosylase, partial [Acidimicrobiia bacterium]|nr:DNA-3-methyladenine glycosylase [Acidimicrobiia bacterium]